MLGLKGLVNKLGEHFFKEYKGNKQSDLDIYGFLKKIYGKNILPYIICDTDFDEELLGLIIHLEEKQKQHHPLTNQLLIHGIETFLLSLLIRYPDRFSKGTDVSKSDADIVNLLDYIELNISTVTLESLAATFHYTPNYLSALIKEHYGRNFKDIVTDIRLRNAAELLKTSDDNMAEIAEQAGYADKSYFHRVFKARYGMTPVEFRRQTKTGQ